MIDAISAFYRLDPLVASLLTVGLLVALSVVCLVGHHARKERRDREAADRFHRIMQASTPPPPRAPGFKSRRVG